jgi:glutaredoxin
MSVVMYVKPDCPYCQAAREHLAAEGETVEERLAGWLHSIVDEILMETVALAAIGKLPSAVAAPCFRSLGV